MTVDHHTYIGKWSPRAWLMTKRYVQVRDSMKPIPVDADSTPDVLRTFERRMTWLIYAVAAGIAITVALVLNP